MSTTSGTPTSARSHESPQREWPQQQLADFLANQTSRYVPLSYISKCDAIFVNHWFSANLFVPIYHPQSQHTDRLLELMNPAYNCAAVMGIKLLVVNRNNVSPDRFRLRWSHDGEELSELFLISCFGLPNHVAVVPRAYLLHRYGDSSNIEGVWELGQACPSLLAPFMVHYRDLVEFLGKIFQHADASATDDLVNPTYGAIYHGFKAELVRFHQVLPRGGRRDKLLAMRDLYLACRVGMHTMRISRKSEPGHFILDGYAVEYHRRSFCRVGTYGDYLRITLTHQLTGSSAWMFLLLEDQIGREAIFLPRHLVPSHLIGYARPGGHNNIQWPQVEVMARPFVPFMFLVQTPLHTADATGKIMRDYALQVKAGSGDGVRRSTGEQDSEYENSPPRRTRSGMEDWIMDLLHKET